jgi:hypothetical protein
MGSESSVMIGAINCGGTGAHINPFEYLPAQASSAEWAVLDELLQAAHRRITTETLTSDINEVVCRSLAEKCNSRIHSLDATVSIGNALFHLDLSLDKRGDIGRINPYTRANSRLCDGDARQVFQVVCSGTTHGAACVLAELHESARRVYTEEWAGRRAAESTGTKAAVDLILFDLLCMRAACEESEAYTRLARYSPYCRNDTILPSADIIAMGRPALSEARVNLREKANLRWAAAAGIFVVAESPSEGGVRNLFDDIAFTVVCRADPRCPISIVGIGNAIFMSDRTAELQAVLSRISPGTSHSERTMCVLANVDDKSVACVGVHWHKMDSASTALLLETVLSTVLRFPDVDLATVAGDFNFQSPADAQDVASRVAPFGTAASVMDSDGRVMTTKCATRSLRQAQVKKGGVLQHAPRMMVFSRGRSEGDPTCLASMVVNGGSQETPNAAWPFDHGGVATLHGFNCTGRS